MEFWQGDKIWPVIELSVRPEFRLKTTETQEISDMFPEKYHYPDGGRFAAAVWCSADKVPVLAIAVNTVVNEGNSPPRPSPKVAGPFSLSDENMLKNSFIKSGFRGVSVERVNVTFEFDSAEAYTSCILDTSASLHALLTKETQERRKEILKAVTEAAGKYTNNNTGKVRLENETLLVVGKK